jgi:glyoxylase-like metal-dependent hydrolase (beta-lactamase superfamily II)
MKKRMPRPPRPVWPVWDDGRTRPARPIQTFAFDATTYILRQSLATHFEAPFVYLLLGMDRAILVDTGTGDVDFAAAVGPLVGDRELVVAHSHSHSDHVGGDGAFAGRTKTVIVGKTPDAVRSFFGIPRDDARKLDLGDRVVDVLPIPGHEASHVAYYDHATGILLTGDMLYPGRLTIEDWGAYRASVMRLQAFANARNVSFVLGGHIELSAAGPDYTDGATQHPDEHALALGTSELAELAAVVAPMRAPLRTVRPHFILSP